MTLKNMYIYLVWSKCTQLYRNFNSKRRKIAIIVFDKFTSFFNLVVICNDSFYFSLGPDLL